MLVQNDFQSIDDLRFVAEKCPRCSLCKFPPLVRVEHGRHSGCCPSYEELAVHAASGGGLMVAALSIADGRARPTETLRRLAFSCTACGACDVSCKYNSDIEVLEAILQLRARLFQELGPAPAHRAVLDAIRDRGHPLPEAATARDAWLEDLGLSVSRDGGDYLLWVGPHYALERRHRATLRRALDLLCRAGVRFSTLGADEPYAGRAALEIGDRQLFAECSRRAATAIHRSRARAVLCLSAEDYATLRAQTPRFAPVTKPVRHLVELYADLLRRRKLKPRHPLGVTAGWHDSSYLGRLSEPWNYWSGEKRKVLGQMIVYEPNRRLRYGRNGCYDAPRAVLRALPGVQLREFLRREEYAFDSGETGQTAAFAPELALAAARRRLAEAADAGIELVVTECPQARAALDRARTSNGRGVAVCTLTELLSRSIEGE